MTLPADFLAVMQLAYYQPFEGEDQWGNNTYGSECALHVRLEPESVSMNTSATDSGEIAPTTERNVQLIADYVSPNGVAVKGKITVNDFEYRITGVTTHYDEHGPYYQDLTCTINIER